MISLNKEEFYCLELYGTRGYRDRRLTSIQQDKTWTSTFFEDSYSVDGLRTVLDVLI